MAPIAAKQQLRWFQVSVTVPVNCDILGPCEVTIFNALFAVNRPRKFTVLSVYFAQSIRLAILSSADCSASMRFGATLQHYLAAFAKKTMR